MACGGHSYRWDATGTYNEAVTTIITTFVDENTRFRVYENTHFYMLGMGRKVWKRPYIKYAFIKYALSHAWRVEDTAYECNDISRSKCTIIVSKYRLKRPFVFKRKLADSI